MDGSKIDCYALCATCLSLQSCKREGLPGTLQGQNHVYAHLQNFLLSHLEKMPGLTPQLHLGLHAHPQHPALPAVLQQEPYYLRRLDHRSHGFSAGCHTLVHFVREREGERGVLPIAATTGCDWRPQQQVPHIVRSSQCTCPGYILLHTHSKDRERKGAT